MNIFIVTPGSPASNAVHLQLCISPSPITLHCRQPVHNTQPTKCTMFYLKYLYRNTENSYMFQST